MRLTLSKAALKLLKVLEERRDVVYERIDVLSQGQRLLIVRVRQLGRKEFHKLELQDQFVCHGNS